MTPIEIQNYEFSTQPFGGYSKKQVTDFLEETSKEFEKYYRENRELKDRITVLNDSLKNFKAMEESLQNTLLFAQNTAEDIKKAAQQKAEAILEEARVKAADIITETDGKKMEAERALEDIQNQYKIFRAKYEALLQSELKLFEDMK